LIELLVVISIIGILSSFAMVSLNAARIKARDALRKGDMAQLRTALSLYYDDEGRYPICNGGNWLDIADPTFGAFADEGSVCYNTEMTVRLENPVRPYMMNVPKDPMNENNDSAAADPVNGSDTYLYRYTSDDEGTQCAIIYYLEEDPAPKTPQIIRGF